MTEINSFDIYPWHKQSVYGTCQEIILPTTWKKIPSGWVTPEIILLNDLKTPQKWRLAFPRPLIFEFLVLLAYIILVIFHVTPILAVHVSFPTCVLTSPVVKRSAVERRNLKWDWPGSNRLCRHWPTNKCVVPCCHTKVHMNGDSLCNTAYSHVCCV